MLTPQGKFLVDFIILKEGDYFLIEANYKDIYEINIPGYNNIIQTQLITSRGKPKTYYVTSNKDNKKYILKGPMTFDMRKQVMRSERIKKALGLNQLNVEFVNIFQQNWMKADCLLDYDYHKKILKGLFPEMPHKGYELIDGHIRPTFFKGISSWTLILHVRFK